MYKRSIKVNAVSKIPVMMNNEREYLSFQNLT